MLHVEVLASDLAHFFRPRPVELFYALRTLFKNERGNCAGGRIQARRPAAEDAGDDNPGVQVRFPTLTHKGLPLPPGRASGGVGGAAVALWHDRCGLLRGRGRRRAERCGALQRRSSTTALVARTAHTVCPPITVSRKSYEAWDCFRCEVNES